MSVLTGPRNMPPLSFTDLDPTELVAQATMQQLIQVLENIAAVNARLSTLVQKAAYLEMPPDGTPFNEAAYVMIPAIGASATILSFQVPGGKNGTIKWIGNNYVGSGFTEGTGDLVWQLQADGQPIRNMQRIVGSLGSPASPSETAAIRIYESQTITLVCTNVAVVAAQQLLGGRLSGWYYPIEYDAQGVVPNEDDED
jgi:hypothetical protein